MLNLWPLSVVALNLRVLSTMIAFCRSEEVHKTVRGSVLLTNAPDTAVPQIDRNFLQFFGHPRAAIAALAQTRLFLDLGQNNHVRARLAGRLRKARNPRGLTFITRHNRSVGKLRRCSSTNLNLTAFEPRRTGWPFLEHVPLLAQNTFLTPKPFVLKRKLAILDRHHIYRDAP